MNTPVVRPLRVGPPIRGTRLITVVCPHCGSEHTHGWPVVIAGAPGMYRSHCRDEAVRGTYRITHPLTLEENHR